MKFKKLYLIVCGIFILGYFYIEYKSSQNIQNIKKYFEFNAEIVLKKIEEIRLNALAMSIIVSQNKEIKECILENDFQKCQKILQSYTSTLTQIPIYQNVLFHLHSKNLISIARSFEDNKYGDNLSTFRFTLKEVKKTITPISGIEAGRCGVFIRGIAPIFIDNKFSGSSEVMLDFKPIFEIAKREGFDIFILIDDKFKSDCFFEKDQILKNFIILNKENSNLNLASILQKIDFKNQNFIKFKNNYFFSKKLYDLYNNYIGYIIIHINNDKKNKFISNLKLVL
ncbi:hypothetical protein F1B92_00900 [Campylobacter sp. FMV-PI01]|uniref:Double Cache domain-containing protein n=1 Tax=Campylobacter portucalensis TaxID=2608384 RepID=A0A6L5WIB9_9BACT|nr:cache domain-containing protein [Campylobacter portucalensis]MSN95765.1 hypothetical protein [Campylobacter portucalensis]